MSENRNLTSYTVMYKPQFFAGFASMREARVGQTFLFLFLWFRRCRHCGLFHDDARFHGADGGYGPVQILALLARQQTVLTNWSVQLIDRRIQLGTVNFIILLSIPVW